jgi:hypothetical protein
MGAILHEGNFVVYDDIDEAIAVFESLQPSRRPLAAVVPPARPQEDSDLFE